MYGCRADLGVVFWGSYTQGGRMSEFGCRMSEVRSRRLEGGLKL